MSTCYGYWVSKDEVYEVPQYSHSETGYEILNSLYGEGTRERIDNSHWGIYRHMFTLGFIRIVNWRNDEYGVQYRTGTKLSKLQKEFIKDATRVDPVTRCDDWTIL